MKTILQRSLTGGIYVAVLLGSLLLHPAVFLIVLLVFTILGLSELQRMLGLRFGVSGNIWIILNGLAFVSGSGILLRGSQEYWLIPIVVLLGVQIILPLFTKNESGLPEMLIPAFGSIYISLPLLLLGYVHLATQALGIPVVLSVLVMIWTHDTFAYLTGISFGRHKMAEKISPKKTWEGFAGGMLMTVVAGLVFSLFYPEIQIPLWLILSFTVGLAAVVGDLVESFIKRNTGVKDSGSFLPGHGGILDRIDSILIVSPVVYVFFNIYLNS